MKTCNSLRQLMTVLVIAIVTQAASAARPEYTYTLTDITEEAIAILPDTLPAGISEAALADSLPHNIYAHPYSLNDDVYPQWHRMWINTAVLSGAFIGSLLVLECLPEDATSWNRAELRDVPLFDRWYDHVIKKGPEWDHDKFIFNYVLHPYAGAAYFMSARSCGFNFWRSLLYCSLISTVGWEFGIEAFMERPSYQDIFITPIVGSCIGELFYRTKRHIVSHDYTLGGSRLLGNVVVFLIDPVNEVINLFRGSDTRRMHLGKKEKSPAFESQLIPVGAFGSPGFTLTMRF